MLDTGKFPKGISSSITVFLKADKQEKKLKAKKSIDHVFSIFSW